MSLRTSGIMDDRKFNFSETTFAFGLTHDFLRSIPRRYHSTLIAPSTYEEGKLGYDLEIQLPGVLVLLQFKISEIMFRRYQEKHVVQNPFYKFKLRHERNHAGSWGYTQHELLLEWASLSPNDPLISNVCYVAPFFHTLRRFHDLFSGPNGEVLKHSVFANVLEFPSISRGKHHVSYDTNSRGWCFSEPNEVPFMTWDQFLNDVSSNLTKREENLKSIINRTWKALKRAIENSNALKDTLFQEQSKDFDNDLSVDEMLRVIANFIFITTGGFLFVIQPSTNN